MTQRRIWVLAGEKAGDNAQCLSLAGALGWPTEVKSLRYNELVRSRLRLLADTRFELDRIRSSPIEPPWPDLVIGCGRRSVATAFEIRQRAGSRTRLVQIGRPRAKLERFDLVVTTAQYRLPLRPNVVHLTLPMHPIDLAARERAGEQWASTFAKLPRPRFALLVGGSAKPYVFDEQGARRLATQVNELARAEGGSLLVSTSRRTSEAAAQTLCDLLDVPSYVHRWTSADGPNPYLAYLALADAFVVTGDSASMLAEACSTGRRVWFAGLSMRTSRSLRWRARTFIRRLLLPAGRDATVDDRTLSRWLAAIPAFGWVRYPRELGQLHARLAEAGRALPLGQPFVAPIPPPLDESALAAARVLELF